jgi:aminoglycoside phosphotransferase (APT) family kinase protein
VAAALPAGVPAPRLLSSFEWDGWVTLLFEDVDGHQPVQPWLPDELDRVLAAMAELAEALTPSPIEVPTAAELFGQPFRGWRRLVRAQARGEELTGLDPWALHNLAGLAELEAGWEAAGSGDCLAHGDIRADNLLLTGSRVFLVDWPWACLAQPWFDLMGMLPSVRMQGGPPSAEIFDNHPTARGADPSAVNAVLAAQTGYWIERGRQPAPPGLPSLRPFQHAQGMASLEWLKASVA